MILHLIKTQVSFMIYALQIAYWHIKKKRQVIVWRNKSTWDVPSGMKLALIHIYEKNLLRSQRDLYT